MLHSKYIFFSPNTYFVISISCFVKALPFFPNVCHYSSICRAIISKLTIQRENFSWTWEMVNLQHLISMIHYIYFLSFFSPPSSCFFLLPTRRPSIALRTEELQTAKPNFPTFVIIGSSGKLIFLFS